MQIAIISDIHDNIPNLTKVLNYCRENKIEKIICCGDLASLETLDFLNDNFKGEIFFVFGNMDNDYLKNKFFKCHSEQREAESRNLIRSLNKLEMTTYKNTKIFKDFGETEIVADKGAELPIGSLAPKTSRGEISKIKIAFVHFPDVAKKLAETGKYDFVFHGHTHKPWCSEVLTKDTLGTDKKCTVLNPGNVANQIYPPTFAVWNTSDNSFS